MLLILSCHRSLRPVAPLSLLSPARGQRCRHRPKSFLLCCWVGRAARRAILTDCGDEHDGESDEHGDVVSYPGKGKKRHDLREDSSFQLVIWSCCPAFTHGSLGAGEHLLNVRMCPRVLFKEAPSV